MSPVERVRPVTVARPAAGRSRCPGVFFHGLVALVLLTPAPGATLSGQEIGDETGAGEGALFLLLPVGAHGVGLGRAMTALESEEAAFWNPAGLARQRSRRVMVYRGNQIAGDATAVNVLLPWNRVGTFGFSYLLLDIGDQVLRNDFGDRLGRISVRNHAGILSYATSFPGRVHAGINMKLVQFRIACRGQCPDFATSSSAYAIDAGIQAEPFRRIPLRFGWMIAHAGTEFQVFNEAQSDPLPTRIRFAVAYDLLRRLESEDLALWATLETEDRARDPGSPSLYTGLNLSAADLFYVRAGYVGGKLDQTNGAAVGLGIRIDRFDLNLAKSLTRSAVTGASEPLHATFGITF